MANSPLNAVYVCYYGNTYIKGGITTLLINFKKKKEIEKFSLITIHGLYTQVKNDLISIENAERMFFSPYIMGELQKYNVRQEIIDLVHEGTELENFETFNISIEKETSRLLKETEALLKEYKDIEFTEEMLTEFIIPSSNTSYSKHPRRHYNMKKIITIISILSLTILAYLLRKTKGYGANEYTGGGILSLT